jgi:hypothetical protein
MELMAETDMATLAGSLYLILVQHILAAINESLKPTVAPTAEAENR